VDPKFCTFCREGCAYKDSTDTARKREREASVIIAKKLKKLASVGWSSFFASGRVFEEWDVDVEWGCGEGNRRCLSGGETGGSKPGVVLGEVDESCAQKFNALTRTGCRYPFTRSAVFLSVFARWLESSKAVRCLCSYSFWTTAYCSWLALLPTGISAMDEFDH